MTDAGDLMHLKVRALSEHERKRFREMYTKLWREPEQGEPTNEDQRLQTRIEQLRAEYADVFALIGC